MKQRPFVFIWVLALIVTFPAAAFAYLPVLIGLVGAVGGTIGVVITAILGAIYLTYRLLRGKKEEQEEVETETSLKDDGQTG